MEDLTKVKTLVKQLSNELEQAENTLSQLSFEIQATDLEKEAQELADKLRPKLWKAK